MFGHRKCFGRFQTYTGVPGGYRNPPGKYWALVGLEGRERAAARRWRAPSQEES